MLSHPRRKILALLGLVLLTSGCGAGYPSVSGKVTADGKPVKWVRVIFAPVSTKENPFPGPYAEGRTADDGTYSLVTRHGAVGATVGENVVELYSSEKIELDFMKSQAEMYFAQASGDKSHPSYSAGVELQREIKSINSQSARDGLTPVVKTRFVVPDSGTDSANFELLEFMDQKPSRN